MRPLPPSKRGSCQPFTRPPWEIGGKCKQRTSESNDDCEHDCSIPKHTTPQARGYTPSGFLLYPNRTKRALAAYVELPHALLNFAERALP